MKKIYLDIDGTILHEELDKYNQPANHLQEFLEALECYDVYWLTTHCRDNDPTHVRLHLQRKLPPELFQYVLRYKPVTWDINKTEAIDFNSDFLWFDNDVMQSERDALASHNATRGLVEVDLRVNPSQLMDITRNILK